MDELDVVPKNRMPKLPRTVALLAASLSLAGCVLPVPHRRLHSAGLEATVVDADTASPVDGAKVSSPDGSSELASTDSEGHFEIPAQYGWHGAYLVGPISYSLLPHFDIPYPRPPLKIEAAGYRSRTIQPFDEVQTDRSTGKAMIRLQSE